VPPPLLAELNRIRDHLVEEQRGSFATLQQRHKEVAAAVTRMREDQHQEIQRSLELQSKFLSMVMSICDEFSAQQLRLHAIEARLAQLEAGGIRAGSAR
jgi:hypothetical protein